MISIAIVFHNHVEGLKQVLRSLVAQTFCLGSLEILLVDNNSSDFNEGEFKNFSQTLAGLEMRYFRMRENNMGRARALAIEKASYPWVAFIDSDCVAEPQWLENLSRELFKFDDTRVIGASGVAIYPRGTSLHSQSRHLLQKVPWTYLRAPQLRIPARTIASKQISTSNCLLNKERVLELGNFSPKYGEVCEDVEFSMRASQNDRGFIIVPSARVWHFQQSGWISWFQRMKKYGRGQTLVLSEHGRWPVRLVAVSFLLFLLLMLAIFRPTWIALVSLSYLILVVGSALFHSNALKKDFYGFLVLAPLTHFSYALGMILGLCARIFKSLLGQRKSYFGLFLKRRTQLRYNKQ